MSIFRHEGNGIPGEGKRVHCRRVYVSRTYVSGPYGKYPADCHILWSAIILVLAGSCFFTVNVEFLRIRGFLFQKIERNERK